MNSYIEKKFLDLVELNDVLLPDCNYLDVSDCVRQCDVLNQIIVGHLNIHSIPNKHQDLIDLLDKMNEKNLVPDVLLLCETFFNERNYDRFSFWNFDIVSLYRKNKSQGGVSIMIRKGLKFYEREDLNIFKEGKFESIFIEIPRQSENNIVVGEVYRIPGTNENEFLLDYETIVNKIRNENKKVIIGTDQNLDFLKIHIHNNTMRFFEMNITNNLLPTMIKPTRVTHSTATLIDNIYVDAELCHNVKSFILTTDISDHFMCVTKLQCAIFKKEIRSFTTRKFNNTVYRNISGALCNKNWDFLEEYSVHDASVLLLSVK